MRLSRTLDSINPTDTNHGVAQQSHSQVCVLRTGDVPQLQPHHRLVIPTEHLEGEIHADGGAVMLGEDVVHVALDDGSLADAQVPDDEHFEQPLALHPRREGLRRGRRGQRKLEEFREGANGCKKICTKEVTDLRSQQSVRNHAEAKHLRTRRCLSSHRSVRCS